MVRPPFPSPHSTTSLAASCSFSILLAAELVYRLLQWSLLWHNRVCYHTDASNSVTRGNTNRRGVYRMSSMGHRTGQFGLSHFLEPVLAASWSVLFLISAPNVVLHGYVTVDLAQYSKSCRSAVSLRLYCWRCTSKKKSWKFQSGPSDPLVKHIVNVVSQLFLCSDWKTVDKSLGSLDRSDPPVKHNVNVESWLFLCLGGANSI